MVRMLTYILGEDTFRKGLKVEINFFRIIEKNINIV
jgi:hypothetical protein